MHDAEDGDKVAPRTMDYGEEDLEVAKKVKVPVLIARIDCVEYDDFCDKQEIDGYPTLKLYVNGRLDKVRF